MKIVEVFEEAGRKIAILSEGGEKFIAWKSLSKGKWFIAPFAVELLGTYWIAKKAGLLLEPPSETIAGLEKRSVKRLRNDEEAIRVFSKHGLLRQSETANGWLTLRFPPKEIERMRKRKYTEGALLNILTALVHCAEQEFIEEIRAFHKRRLRQARVPRKPPGKPERAVRRVKRRPK